MEKTLTFNSKDGSYDAVIFSSDNGKKLVMLQTAYSWLKKKAYAGEILAYFDPLPITNRKDSRILYATSARGSRYNGEDHVAMRLTNVVAEEKNGIILKVIGTFVLQGPKKDLVENLLEVASLNLQIKPRCIVGQGERNSLRRYIQFITGFYLVQVSVKEVSCGG